MKRIILSAICGAFMMLLAPSCSHDDGDDFATLEEQTAVYEQSSVANEPAATVWHVTLNAKTAPNGLSKALSGNYTSGFKGQFAKDEFVYAYKGDNLVGELTAQSDGETTKFDGIWMTEVSVDDVLELRYLSPGFEYDGQDGTLESACKHFYATATVKVTAVDADAKTVSLEDATFEFCSSMVKFTLTERDVTSFEISDGKNYIKLALAAATREIYVSLPPSEGKTDYTIMASDGTINFSVIKSYNLENNKYYSANVTFFKALKGEFSVDEDGHKVKFGAGNLRYNADASAWSFAPSQFSRIGNTSGNASETEGVRDLFGWGTWLEDGKPMNSSTDVADYSWPAGKNSVIGSDWKTLSQDEWNYLFFLRTTTNEIRYSKGVVHGINGVVLLPDDWAGTYSFANSNTANAAFAEISNDDWATLESEGAVFLPVTGRRSDGIGVNGMDMMGYYWTSTPNGDDQARGLKISESVVELSMAYYQYRYYGYSVRLVRSVSNYSPGEGQGGGED
ncbi:MAG: hypothetical protein J6X05_09205 [Bacteroidales bacterium]|nr:hypothetical protein [Bacteroidales bacterium]